MAWDGTMRVSWPKEGDEEGDEEGDGEDIESGTAWVKTFFQAAG